MDKSAKKGTANETVKKLAEVEIQCILHGNQPCTCYSGGDK